MVFRKRIVLMLEKIMEKFIRMLKNNSIEINSNSNGSIYQDCNIVNITPDKYIKNEVKDAIDVKSTFNSIAFAMKNKSVCLPNGYQPDINIFNGKVRIESKPISEEVALKYPQNIKGRFDVIIPSGKTINDLFDDAIMNNKAISIKNVEMKKYIGDIVDPYQDDFQEEIKGKSFKLMPKLIESAKKRIAIYIDNRKYYETKFYPVFNNKNEVIFSNKYEKEYYIFDVKYSFDNHSISFSYNVNAVNWQDILEYNTFIKDATKGKRFIIKLLDDETSIIDTILNKNISEMSIEDIDFNVSLAKKILLIQNSFGKTFPIDKEIKESDLNNIEFLSNSINKIPSFFNWSSLKITATDIKIPLKNIDSEFKLEFLRKESIDIFCVKIDNISIIYTYELARINKETILQVSEDVYNVDILPSISNNRARKIAVFDNNKIID